MDFKLSIPLAIPDVALQVYPVLPSSQKPPIFLLLPFLEFVQYCHKNKHEC